MEAWAGERAAARLSGRVPAAVLVLALALSGAAPVRAEITVFSGAVVIDASGVTAVADLGGPMWNFEVRALARASPPAMRAGYRRNSAPAKR